MYFKSLYKIIIVLNLSFNLFSQNPLTKIFLHLGNCEDKFVCYFNKNPQIKLLSKKDNNQKIELLFFLPEIIINEEVDNLINKINSTKSNYYKIFILKEHGGLKIKFIYDPAFVYKIEVSEFDAISSFKGIVFTILHKKIVHEKPNLNFLNFKPKILIDIGHGGHDCGAKGSCNVTEKEITYSIGKKLQKLLEKNGFNVFLTRDNDKFVGLDERTYFANFLPAAIFISLHANFSQNKNASGIETFYADHSLLNSYNFEDQKKYLIRQKNNLLDENNKLVANIIHQSVYEEAKKINPDLIDRKVKRSVSQVLLGTEMTSILIELGFLSNSKECLLLSDPKYQQSLANGIFNGIKIYFNQLN